MSSPSKLALTVSTKTLHVLQASSSLNKLSKLFVKNLEPAVSSLSSSQLRLLRTTSPPIGLAQVFAHDLLTSEGPKLHAQNMLMSPFLDSSAYQEACSIVAPVQNNDYLTF